MKKEYLKWSGFIAGIVIFSSIVRDFITEPSTGEWYALILFYIIISVPSIISSLLCVCEKFSWWLVFFGVIYIHRGVTFAIYIKQPEIIENLSILGTILGGLILFFIPFVNKFIIVYPRR